MGDGQVSPLWDPLHSNLETSKKTKTKNKSKKTQSRDGQVSPLWDPLHSNLETSKHKNKKQKQKNSVTGWTSQSIVGSITLQLRDKQTQKQKTKAKKLSHGMDKSVHCGIHYTPT